MSKVFELSASDVTQSEHFRFKLPGGKKIFSLPNMNRLPIGAKINLSEVSKPLAEAKRRGREPRKEDVDAAAMAPMRLLERYCPGILDEIDESQARELLNAWAEHSGIGPGE